MNRTRRGFTILEILIAISIMVLMITIVSFSFSKLNSSQTLDTSADLVVSILNETRSLTLSAVDDSQYGVNFEASQIVLFKGSIYLSADPSNVVTELNPQVGLRNVILNGGGTSVIFKRLTGNTVETGTVEIFLKASTTIFRTITISATGIVELD
ncbi:MAG: prepilin-type N-terminal cleavage/methylation domain-containing protein [bacterium]|nr:prepilin-type N-terminal cleavage/methylation domain-containing protein [bacterium]